jgi:hypothetical protein
MKLLDEKGLTTVWAAIKNTFTSKSDADGKYAKKSEAATHTSAGVMTASDKIKLDGIASGANNYTLPTASTTTLGGIKISRDASGDSWPICVDGNGLAETKIGGLARGDNNSIVGLAIEDSYANTYYSTSSISVSPLADERSVELTYPLKDGTFALTSDIPDVSSLCKFNSANAIELCVYGRINLMTPIGDVNLDSISGKDGIIIFANLTNSCNITCSEGFVYNNDYIDNNKRVEPGTFLITIDRGVPLVLSL